MCVCVRFTAEFPVSMRRYHVMQLTNPEKNSENKIISTPNSIINFCFYRATKMNGEFDFKLHLNAHDDNA